MPRYYRRRYRRRPVYRRRRRGGITYLQAGSKLARGAYKLARWAASHINAEFKVYEQSQSSTSVTNTGVITTLNNMTQGTDATERIGRQIRNKSLQWRMTLKINSSATTSKVRLILLKDTEPAVGTLALSDILTGGDMDAFKKFSERSRIVFLRDMTINLDQDFRPEVTLKGFLRMNDHSMWDGSSNMLKGRYMFFCVSDEATNTPTIDSNFRLRFLDN